MPDSPPQYETLLFEKRGRVGLITLNRPEKLNAWNPRMESEFIDCVTRAAAGLGNALFLALTGRIIEAAEAKERGLVDRVVPHDSLIDEAMTLADEIAANPNDAIWAAKRLIHENAAEADLRRVVTQEGYAIREMRRLPDHAEAVRAFMEKREPKFNQ